MINPLYGVKLAISTLVFQGKNIIFALYRKADVFIRHFIQNKDFVISRPETIV